MKDWINMAAPLFGVDYGNVISHYPEKAEGFLLSDKFPVRVSGSNVTLTADQMAEGIVYVVNTTAGQACTLNLDPAFLDKYLAVMLPGILMFGRMAATGAFDLTIVNQSANSDNTVQVSLPEGWIFANGTFVTDSIKLKTNNSYMRLRICPTFDNIGAFTGRVHVFVVSSGFN